MSTRDFPDLKSVPERRGDYDLPTDRPRHLRDFANLSNDAFIESAYGAALHRRSDPGGRACYLGLLAQGMSRAEILSCLIKSQEGRSVGARIDGLYWASRWGRIRRVRIVRKAYDIGKRLWPLTTVRSDVAKLTQDLERFGEMVRAIDEESKRGSRDIGHQLERVQSELLTELAKRASRENLDCLQTALVDLGARVADVSHMNEYKADQSSLVGIQEDMRTNLYRGLDDLDRRIRILLDGKAGADTVTESYVAFEKRLLDSQQDIESRMQAIEARKADLSAIQETRAEMLQGLTSVSNVQANFRTLLDKKAGTDATTEMAVSFEARLLAVRQEVQSIQHDMELQIKSVDARKADLSAIDAARADLIATQHAIAAMNKDLRKLMDTGAGTDPIRELGITFEARLNAVREELQPIHRTLQAIRQDTQHQIQSVDARKADLSAVDATRAEILAAVRAALTGLTGTVSSVAANKIDRATMNVMLAENSQRILDNLQESVQELRSCIDALPARKKPNRRLRPPH
jgi:hypothetical protein